MARWLARFVALTALVAAAQPAAARADTSVVVLGLRATDGDDEVARTVSGLLRHEARRVRGWAVADADPTLAQMTLAHGCDTPDAACLSQVAETVSAQMLLFGFVRRSGTDLVVEVSVFAVASGQIERTQSLTLSARRTDVDDIRDPVRGLVSQLAGPQSGTLRIATNVAGARVIVDGTPRGTTDADGAWSGELPAGEHSVEIEADSYATWSGPANVGESEASLTATLVAVGATTGGGEGGGGGGGGPSINWPGIALIAAGALAFGGAIYSWARLGSIQNEPDYAAYRDRVPVGLNTCDEASANRLNWFPADGGSEMTAQAQLRHAADLCSEAGVLEVLQYVFLGVAIAGVGVGALLIALDAGGSSDDASASSGATLELDPVVGPDRAYLGLTLRL